MVKYLISRPVAVIMSFVAVLLLGVVASGLLPVSLLPAIDMPEITVQLVRPGESVRAIEQGIVEPLRYQLLQVPHLETLTSECKDGKATIRLRFGYNTDVNYAFIDVNEKVDAAMRSLPSDMQRPAIIKASAADLPVFYINISSTGGDSQFIELCQLARAVLIKRLEQLPEVAMVDMTGQVEPELHIEPNEPLLQSLGISHKVISLALEENNVSLGSLEVTDGQYRYNIRIANSLQTPADVAALPVNVNGRLLTLGELAKIELRPQRRSGMFEANGQQALSLAVIKQSDARMDDIRNNVNKLIANFEREYPLVQVEVSRDQTELLDYSISNLKQDLIYGGILAFLILFFFLKDARSPWLIGLSVPTALIMSFLLFYVCGISINIVSLSGLILGVGMMIDNSIIVIDNIIQYMERGEELTQACIRGTTEVIAPLVSSLMSTCAVFVPLVFLSGISGALFYDQAVSVAVGLTASLIVSITLTPVLFHLWSGRNKNDQLGRKGKVAQFLQKLDLFKTEDLYEKGFMFTFKYRKVMMVLFPLLLLPAVILVVVLPKQRFPDFEQKELIVDIDWNEKINLGENQKRVAQLHTWYGKDVAESNSYIGTQQFMFHKDVDLTLSEASLYIKCYNPSGLQGIKDRLSHEAKQAWPKAIVSFKAPATVFEKIFGDDEPLLVARISDNKTKGMPESGQMANIIHTINKHVEGSLNAPPLENYIEIRALPEMMALYQVTQADLVDRLKTALNARRIGVLHTGAAYVPMVLGLSPASLETILAGLKVPNLQNQPIPVSAITTIRMVEDYKYLYGSNQGAYVPVSIDSLSQPVQSITAAIGKELKAKHDVDVQFTGSFFANRKLMKEMVLVLLVSLAMLYFILAAQFESLTQPLILLIEIPIDISGALFMLWLFGSSINIMAMIGIVVMSGIVVNDSILKIDTINRLRKDGMPLMQAIHTGGNRRLKPIIMTSLTTILGLVPVLFGGGIGNELQQPLALTLIGSMVLGTIVSLFFIPLCYYYLHRKSEVKNQEIH